MKEVNWVDRKGRNRKSLLRDSDPDELAEQGVPLGPPDVDLIDWEAVKTDLHNILLEQGIINWDDVIRRQTSLQSASVSALKKHLVMLYKGTR